MLLRATKSLLQVLRGKPKNQDRGLESAIFWLIRGFSLDRFHSNGNRFCHQCYGTYLLVYFNILMLVLNFKCKGAVQQKHIEFGRIHIVRLFKFQDAPKKRSAF